MLSSRLLILLHVKINVKTTEEYPTAVEAVVRRTMPAVVAPLASTGAVPFNSSDQTLKISRVYFSITPSGVYTALGDTMDFSALGDLLKSGQPPIFCVMISSKASGNSGYDYVWVPGTTLLNSKFQVLQCAGAGAPMADIGGGAYPAGVTADTIIGYADFMRV